ncbi:MAG: hypothetical protein P4N60_09675 [Verrucomicrobiae bacterium]|nr:hypothetical protein [Verrucomicrobiae bacterium]
MNPKILFTLLVMLSAVAGGLSGCQSPPAAAPAGTGVSLRNNGYSLLHQLLAEQKDVSLLRFIKPEHADVKNLVKRIAAASGAGAQLLEKFAADDPTIRLDDFRLPPAEQATRAAIAGTKQKELLGGTGDVFELNLLLTQTEALSYAWHLAKVTSESEPDPDRAQALAGISADMAKLYREVFALLLEKTRPAAVKQVRTDGRKQSDRSDVGWS